MLKKIENFIGTLKRITEIVRRIHNAIQALKGEDARATETEAEQAEEPAQPTVTVNVYFQDTCTNYFN